MSTTKAFNNNLTRRINRVESHVVGQSSISFVRLFPIIPLHTDRDFLRQFILSNLLILILILILS